MGLAGISVWQLAIIMVIVMLIFGTKRIRQLGEDVGAGIKGFKKEVKDASMDDLGEDVIKGAKTLRNLRDVGDKVKDSLK